MENSNMGKWHGDYRGKGKGCNYVKQNFITWDKILAHSAMVVNSLFCDAASKRESNLFSSSAKIEKELSNIYYLRNA